MSICPFCNKEFPSRSIGGHVARCKMNPNYQTTITNDRENLRRGTQTSSSNKRLLKKEFTVTCKKCGKESKIICTQKAFDKGNYRKYCSRSCANTRIHDVETRQKISTTIKKYYGTHNYPEGFQTDIKTYYCKQCGKAFNMFEERDTQSRKYCCISCKNKWLKENLEVTFGGYGCKSGRARSGWYKNIYCASTWELAFLIYHLDHDMFINRCHEKRTYMYEGKTHYYYPDFITDMGIIEIKGQNNPQWEAKHRDNPDIIVLFYKDMKPYLDYVKNKYHKPLIELYDNSKTRDFITDNSKCWMNNGVEEDRIPKGDVSKYLNNGWIKGRLLRNRK